MESVDAVTRRDEKPETAATPAPEFEEAVSPIDADPTAAAKDQADAKRDNPWAPLLNVGLNLLQTLVAPPARKAAGNIVGNGNADPGAWIETDGSTGRSVLKLPLPEPQVLEQLTAALSRLVAGLGR